MDKEILTRNVCKCMVCGKFLESRFQHDWVTCGCKNKSYTDGGTEYVRRGGNDISKVKDIKDFSEEEIRDYLRITKSI